MLSNHASKAILHAEWEQQSAILLSWPHPDSDWQDNIDEINATYINLCKTIGAYQNLIIVCRDKTHRLFISEQLNKNNIQAKRYNIYCIEYNDTWCRDYGPLFTRHNNEYEIINFSFDGWGKKYPAQKDNQLTNQLHKQHAFGSIQLNNHDFILEGGSIDTNGQGTILTTVRCLLKRHPKKNKQEIETILKNTLGVNTVHWLEHGQIYGDDTDGHVDMLARFINPATIAYSACNDSNHPDYESLNKMEQELALLKQLDGSPYQLVPIELPNLKTNNEKPLPASYINFLIINNAVLVPTYDDPHDALALASFKQYFPKRDIIGINSNALIKQFGSLHCATMHIPAGVVQS